MRGGECRLPGTSIAATLREEREARTHHRGAGALSEGVEVEGDRVNSQGRGSDEDLSRLDSEVEGLEAGDRERDQLGAGLVGKRIALVGKLGGMNRREATNLLRSFGAHVVDADAAELDWVVIGAEETHLSGAALLTERVREGVADGRLEVIAETELWQRVGLIDVERSIRRYYTPAMLASLLGVSVRVIRRWHRRGLIVPARTIHRLPYFDFQEIATARRLAELVAAGASPRAIENRLRELSDVLPGVARPLAQLSVLIEGRQVLLRQGEGLIEPGGQLRFDFGASDSEGGDRDRSEILTLADSVPGPRDPLSSREPGARDGGLNDAGWGGHQEDEWLQAVYDSEDEGDLEAAIDGCRAILARDGLRADVCFQLGELLYRDGQIEAARERYYCAIELDESYVEARTSLGCVLAETGRFDLAIAALRGVLKLCPDYPDAHYHLATLLDEQGRGEEATEHWMALRRIAPDHLWSQLPRD